MGHKVALLSHCSATTCNVSPWEFSMRNPQSSPCRHLGKWPVAGLSAIKLIYSTVFAAQEIHSCYTDTTLRTWTEPLKMNDLFEHAKSKLSKVLIFTVVIAYWYKDQCAYFTLRCISL